MKKIFSVLLAAALLAGSGSAVFAADSATTASSGEETSQVPETAKMSTSKYYYGEIIYTGKSSPIVSSNSIVGEIISSPDRYPDPSAELAFDFDVDTQWTCSTDAYFERWVGLKTEEPKSVQSIKIASCGGGPDDDIVWDRIQGSNDGIVWEDICSISQQKYEEYVDYYQRFNEEYLSINFWEPSKEYTYFRYLASGPKQFDYGRIAEFQLFSPNEEKFQSPGDSTQYYYNGPIVYTGTWSTRTAENSIRGMIIGGGETFACTKFSNAFDGKIDTYYHGSGAVFDMWVGLRTSSPIVVKSFAIATQDSDGDGVSDRRHAMWGSRLQGSDDGITWEDIYVYEYVDFEDYANDTENTYLTIDLPDNEKAYRFFRMINNDDGANALAEVQLFSEKIKNPDETETEETKPEEIEPGPVFNLTSLPGTTYFKGYMTLTSGSLENAFDGIQSTYADYGVDGGKEYYVGVKLASPTVLTNVLVWEPDKNGDGIFNKPHYLYGTIVEGSNDGENWESILTLGDSYKEYEEYLYSIENGTVNYFGEVPFDGENKNDKDAMHPVPYTYYRIWNNCLGTAAWGDIALWGFFVDGSPAAPSPVSGDISGNCSLDIKDALLLFQHSMLPNLFPIPYTGNMDFNNDGAVDVNDAMLLFQHSMLPDLFPIA